MDQVGYGRSGKMPNPIPAHEYRLVPELLSRQPIPEGRALGYPLDTRPPASDFPEAANPKREGAKEREAEPSGAARLRESAAEKDRENGELRERVALLDRALQETNARLRAALEDNVGGRLSPALSRLSFSVSRWIKLNKERDSLAQTSKKLARDLQKLESFKRHLMQSLRDDSPSPQETVDITTCDQSVSSKASSCADGDSVAHTTTNQLSGSMDVGSTVQEVLVGTVTKPPIQKYSLSSHITPRLTPEATPKIMSTSASPRRMSTTATPKLMSGATSPSKTRIEGYMSMTPWYPSSKQSSAANSPPRGRSNPGRTPRIDGKEFFRQARSRLSYEQFGAFLANIKELNAHKQSREDTLKKAEEIFGPDNKDLYLSFQGLLNRSLP
uniref:At4g15545-like C-terminal domain-containing protein n=1 Tax=Oryza brachyantha TaxID=4533 RepID=J3LRB8_ORYBR